MPDGTEKTIRQIEKQLEETASKESEEVIENRKEEMRRVTEALKQPNPNISQGERRTERPDRLRDFDYIITNEEQQKDIEEIRQDFKILAGFLERRLPENRHKSVAFTNLEQACMWAIKAISHK